ncbi:LOW QUALITY PROTEIN: hypothetical protein HID58_059551, partial [Brassica napus]
MLLMNEAIERLKQEASSVQGVELETDNKKNWMSSSQLWISNSNSQSQSKRKRKQRGAIMSFNILHHLLLQLLCLFQQILTDYSSRIEQSHPIQKKELRRKWSEELHWRITDALQKIGGSQVATPKQIRDIMKVDGLTNDEVKSQLQKYRMHIRKHPLHPTKNFSASDQPRETQNLISLSRSDSPQGPLD